MKENENLETVRGFLRDFFNGRDPEAAVRYLAPQVRVHNGPLGVRESRDAYVTALAGLFRSIPDIHASEQDAVASGETVVMRLVIEGTHTGELWGVPATGRRLRWDANNLYKVTDGLIVEEWAGEDWASVFQQLGVFKPPFAR